MTYRPTCRFVAATDLRSAFERHRDAGEVVQTNLRLPDDPWCFRDAALTCVVALQSAADAEAAVGAARRGVELVVAVDGDDEWVPRLVRDLDRLCRVELGRPPAPDPRELLDGDQIQLLELMASGLSIPEAASRLFLSLRTAERRIGAAKRLLGTPTTAEAIMMIGGSA